MKIQKITHGFVVQTFENNKCVGQEFIAGDPVDWEDEHGNVINPVEEAEYQPFHMVQPSDAKLHREAVDRFWALLEPDLQAYSNKLNRLLEEITHEEVEILVDEMS